MTHRQAAIIICCYTEDRWGALCRAIDSALVQEFPDFEVIVVVDHNPALLERLKAQYPALSIIENRAQQGLSGARNCGIRAANAEYIAFLDDDAVAEPDWLARLCTPFAQAEVLGVTGMLRPNFLGGLPRWFPDEFYWVVGCTWRGTPTQRAEVRNLIGGSMCIRASVFERVGGFRSEIGRIGTIPLGGEETELCIRARQSQPGAVFIYEPAAVVHHEVPAKRTTWRYFRSRCYAEGRSKALIAGLVGAKDGLSSESAYTMRVLPLGVLRGVRDLFLRGDKHGLQRAGAIIAGLLITTAGYGIGRLRLRKVDLPRPTLPVGEMDG
jgi:glucosyl-dolichyl phosphate glucuronosyltransferase